MRKVCGSKSRVGTLGDQQQPTEGDPDVPLVIVKQELAKGQGCHI